MKHIQTFDGFLTENLDRDDLRELERYADSLFAKLGLDVVFTRHFKERLNDARSGKPITYRELENLFLKAYLKAGQQISKLPTDTEAVLRDTVSNLNAPFKIQGSPDDTENDMIMKTIMKKPNFMSSNPEILV